MTDALIARAGRVRLLLFDVDGVLTDGAILLHADGTESKRFDIRDGTGIVLAERAGIKTGILSARQSAATTERARQLRIPIVRQGAVDKLETYEEILAAEGLTDVEVAYIGDDLLDLPVLARVGLSAAPADAVPEVRSRVHWISSRNGGDGAVRELAELILKAQDRWSEMVARWTGTPSRV
jgi:3-deoxy-D-manno-octulosonate 8-phosphate phosphatase (KDO 8-P phosphatase)